MSFFGIPIRNGLPIGLGSKIGFGSRAFSPASLFAAGEQGAWYDPSDFSTLFQDAAGTTPVTAVEQPVGLMLDKSKGLALGSELVTNGNFATDSDWTKGTDWTIGSGVATKTAGTAANLTQTISSTATRWYRCTATVTRTAGALTVSLGTSGTTAVFNASGTYTFYILAGSSTQTLTFAADASFAGTVDTVSAKELSGNHAYQSTDASRPVLSARVNLLTKTEQFDDAAWTKNFLTVTANATTAPDGTNTADALFETTANNYHRLFLATTVSIAANVTYKARIWLKSNGRQWAVVVFAQGYCWFDLVNGVVGNKSATVTSPTITADANGFWRCEYLDTSSSTFSGNPILYLSDSDQGGSFATYFYTGDVTKGIYIWGADLRVANDTTALPYQRVNTATDYDTTGFPLYLKFETDDILSTNNIDFTATNKMTAWVGVRRFNISSFPMVCELSAGWDNNNGTFGISGGGSASGDWRTGLRGTAAPYYDSATYTPPITNVIAVSFDIAGASKADCIQPRINGVLDQEGGAGTTAGTGNFGNHPLNIGRRNAGPLQLNGRIYSLIIRGDQSTATQIAQTENWVNQKTRAF